MYIRKPQIRKRRISTLIGVCDRQPEREAEGLERLRKHVGLFFRMGHGKTPDFFLRERRVPAGGDTVL